MSFSPGLGRTYACACWGGLSTFRGLVQTDILGLQTSAVQINRGQVGTVVYRSLGSAVNRAVSGVTRDSAGAVLGLVAVELFLTSSDAVQQRTVSDAGGNFVFWQPGSGPFYLVAYKVGSPDVAGTSANTLIAT